MKYSFIIPVKEINDYIRESVPKILEIERDDYEILIFPDQINEQESWPKTRQIPSGHVGPAQKRDKGAKLAQGEILVFIDDDAYPKKNFLDLLDNDFQDQTLCAVGGPAITPYNDTFWQKVSGAVFLTTLGGGCPDRYYPIGQKKFIDDWPSVNLSIRKDDFLKAGGFDCNFWPGEDTKLCLDLIQKTNKKILYNPDLIVYHHRREGLARHLKQVAGYGLHRGFFAKKYPETSLKVKYFIPADFVIFLIGTPILALFVWWPFLYFYYAGLALYFLALIWGFIQINSRQKNFLISLTAILYIIPTHIWYGIFFIKGLFFTKNLISKLR